MHSLSGGWQTAQRFSWQEIHLGFFAHWHACPTEQGRQWRVCEQWALLVVLSSLDSAPEALQGHSRSMASKEKVPQGVLRSCRSAARADRGIKGLGSNTAVPGGLYHLSPQDLFSALIKGPTRTPYEDGLFLFDIQLPNIYPAVPPLFRYLSQCSGRLNPNLYDNGKVCVSLLGTWIGKVMLPSTRP